MRTWLIDTHAHLDFQQFDADRGAVIERAAEAEVKTILSVGTDLATSRKNVAIAEKYAGVYAAAGVHPHEVGQVQEGEIEQLYELLHHPDVCAIGEVGLDYYRTLAPVELQRKYFRLFLDWSLETGKPLIIHTREAESDLLRLLREKSKSGWRGVFHCFPGDWPLAEQVIAMGFCLSFTGVVTFKNARMAEVAAKAPLDRILLETDCPYMAPVPHRGKRNEPAYVQLIAQKIAELQAVPFAEVAARTTENACNLFGFSAPAWPE
jgi:TatD DNase family protein